MMKLTLLSLLLLSTCYSTQRFLGPVPELRPVTTEDPLKDNEPALVQIPSLTFAVDGHFPELSNWIQIAMKCKVKGKWTTVERMRGFLPWLKKNPRKPPLRKPGNEKNYFQTGSSRKCKFVVKTLMVKYTWFIGMMNPNQHTYQTSLTMTEVNKKGEPHEFKLNVKVNYK